MKTKLENFCHTTLEEGVGAKSPAARVDSSIARKVCQADPLAPFDSLGLLEGADTSVRRLLSESIESVTLKPRQILFHHGDASDAMYLVLRGALEVLVDHEGNLESIDTLEPGEPVGELQLLTGGNRTATVMARTKSELLRLPKSVFETAAHGSPVLLQRMAGLIRNRLRHYRCELILPHLFGPLDSVMLERLCSAGQWLHLRRGEELFRQGSHDCSLCIVMSGRLQAMVAEPDGSERVVGEIAVGESVGEMALFTGEERSATVAAIRDSELLRFSREAFTDFSAQYPQLTAEIAKIIIQRLRKSFEGRKRTLNTENIAVLALGDDGWFEEFATRLATELAALRPTIHVNSLSVDELLDTPNISQAPDDDPSAIRIEAWLDELESRHDCVLYECDMGDTNWTRRCLRQADRVLIVLDAADGPKTGSTERELFGSEDGLQARRTLVLVHPEETGLPTGTSDWLSSRSVDSWYHVRRKHLGDIRRLARILTGTAVGVVLSGGGAKGFAHIGVLKAFQEAGIPVDMIGGTSMGSVIAGFHALGRVPEKIADINKKGFAKYKPFKEYTLPLVALVRSRRLDRFIEEQTDDVQIEDLWTTYFCVSTNLTAAEPVVHRRGSLFTAIRASVSIPGVLVPVIDGENLLVDGGVVNNLPGDIMRGFGPGTVIMVDVAPQREAHLDENLVEFPSPWKILAGRLNPFRKPVRVPSILEILGRTTMLGSIHNANLVKTQADYYLRVPVDSYGMLDFDAIDAIVEAGYRCAASELQQWTDLGRINGAPGTVMENVG